MTSARTPGRIHQTETHIPTCVLLFHCKRAQSAHRSSPTAQHHACTHSTYALQISTPPICASNE